MFSTISDILSEIYRKYEERYLGGVKKISIFSVIAYNLFFVSSNVFPEVFLNLDFGKPRILSIKPSRGFAANKGYNGTKVLINGSNFSKFPNKNVVFLGKKKAEVVEGDENKILIRVPHGAKSERIKVRTPRGIALSTEIFRIIGRPRIKKISPHKAKTGEQIVITGFNFIDKGAAENNNRKDISNILDEGFLKVKFGDVESEIVAAKRNEIKVTVPENAQNGRIKVITPAGISISRRGFIVEKPPGSLSGKLTIQPYITLNEKEPNNSLEISQQLNTLPVVVFGDASSSDSGYTLDNSQEIIQDIFYILTDNEIEITLESNSQDADFDLFLIDDSGRAIASSEKKDNGIAESLKYYSFLPEPIFVGVKAYNGTGSYILTLDRPRLTSEISTDVLNLSKEEFVPGEFIVKFKKKYFEGRSKKSSQLENFKIARPITSGLTLLELKNADEILQNRRKAYRINNQLIKNYDEDFKVLTAQMLEKLRSLPEVEIADLNYIRKAYLTPDDKYYNLQWHYSIINLPQAWELTRGNDNVIAAVIDTGIVSEHPDLAGRIIQGYDFISSPKTALDGNGIDDNPKDPGDDPNKKRSSFHGTHVAGTIGAATDNEIGVSGVTWSGKIMPLRVLGAGGGTDYDIIHACLYAAGLPNDSGTVPFKKADVINMSLGGAGYSQNFKEKIMEVINEGVVVVAAAGNENTNKPSYPASFEGVISVGAINLSLKKASYSNFGSSIVVVAPGGNTLNDINNDGYVDGVLSTLADDKKNLFYGFYQGTSMASPHVAGVVALIQSVRLDNGFPLLTPGEIKDILISTAVDIGDPGKDDIYGYGLIDAQRAVEKAINIIRNPFLPVLTTSTSSLIFGDNKTQLTFSIKNSGGGTLIIDSIAGDMPWLTANPSAGSVTENSELIVTVDVIRSELTDGYYSGTVTVASNGGNSSLNISMQVGKFSHRDIGTVYILVVDKKTFKTLNETQTDLSQTFEYTISEVEEGKYFVIAGTDRDDDGFICDDGEACGIYPTFADPHIVAITPKTETSGIDFEVNEKISIFSLNVLKHGFRLKKNMTEK